MRSAGPASPSGRQSPSLARSLSVSVPSRIVPAAWRLSLVATAGSKAAGADVWALAGAAAPASNRTIHGAVFLAVRID